MLFSQNSCEKHQICVSEPHFGEVRSNTRPWMMAHWKAYGQLSIHLNWTFFTVCYSSGVEAKCVQLGCFRRGPDLFALKFYLDKVVPHQPFSASENYRHWATRRWIPHPSVFSSFDQYQSVTNGRICRSIYSACRAKLWHAVKKQVNKKSAASLSPDSVIVGHLCVMKIGQMSADKNCMIKSKSYLYCGIEKLAEKVVQRKSKWGQKLLTVQNKLFQVIVDKDTTVGTVYTRV